jgi:hypothetical protein
MNESDFKKKLPEFFLIFGAEQNLSESHIDKLEYMVHHFQPKTMTAVKKICNYIMAEKLIDKPEDEIIDIIKAAKLL